MPTRICALLLGLVFLFFGIAGLNPHFVYPPPHRMHYYDMSMVGRWGYLFGWLPRNLIHDIIYILLGAVGVFSAATLKTAIIGCWTLFAVCVLFVITGFLPFGINHVWGLLPLFDWNLMLHTVAAILAYYFGFIYPLDLGGAEPRMTWEEKVETRA